MKKSTLRIILIILIILLVLFGGFLIFALLTNNSNDIENNNTNISVEKSSSKLQLDEFNGNYVNGDNSVQLYRNGLDTISMVFVADTTYVSYDLELDSENVLSCRDTLFDETVNITVQKNGNSITVNASSNDENSKLNGINGTYTKEEFTTSGWDGEYVNNDINLILAEYKSGRIYLTIRSGYSIYGTILEDYDNKKITYENVSFGETEKIMIEKINDGEIKVQASSSDEDGMLNKFNGTYTKK